MCVCACACVHVRVYTWACVNVHVCVYVQLCIHMRMCVILCVHELLICFYMHAHAHISEGVRMLHPSKTKATSKYLVHKQL